MSRSLDTFIIDEMIEQYSRLNPTPKPSDRPSFDDIMEAELLVSLLMELKALRMRCQLYEARVIHLNRDKSELDNKLNEKVRNERNKTK